MERITMNEAEREHGLKLVATIKASIKPAIDHIEADKFPLTQGNYDKYLAMFAALADNRPAKALLICKAALECGANRKGVLAAFLLYMGAPYIDVFAPDTKESTIAETLTATTEIVAVMDAERQDAYTQH